MSPIRFPKLGVIAALRRKTDYKRWSDPQNLYSSWASRTERAAELLPAHSRVIEFGAGNRILEGYLDPSCTYTPCDLVDRGPGTIVCDLNKRPLPDFGPNTYDAAVIMGVFEYLTDVPGVVDWLGGMVSTVVLSYACPDTAHQSRRAALGTVDRVSRGWMNSYREDELRAMFAGSGFASTHEESWSQDDGYQHRMFVFSKNASEQN